MKNKIKCINISTTYYLLTVHNSLTVGEYYEFGRVNYRTGKIYIKNNNGIFKFYPLEWFELNLRTIRKVKLSGISKKII